MSSLFFTPASWLPWMWTLDDWLHFLFTVDFALWIAATFWLTRVYLSAMLRIHEGRRAPFIALVSWLGLSHLTSAGFLWYVVHYQEANRALTQMALLSIPLAEISQAIVYLIIGYLLLRRAVDKSAEQG